MASISDFIEIVVPHLPFLVPHFDLLSHFVPHFDLYSDSLLCLLHDVRPEGHQLSFIYSWSKSSKK